MERPISRDGSYVKLLCEVPVGGSTTSSDQNNTTRAVVRTIQQQSVGNNTATYGRLGSLFKDGNIQQSDTYIGDLTVHRQKRVKKVHVEVPLCCNKPITIIDERCFYCLENNYELIAINRIGNSQLKLLQYAQLQLNNRFRLFFEIEVKFFMLVLEDMILNDRILMNKQDAYIIE